MRHPDGDWAGYTYEWNDAQTEATRVVGGKRRVFGTQEWIYPSENECLRCHTAAAGRALGLETAQLERGAHLSADRPHGEPARHARRHRRAEPAALRRALDAARLCRSGRCGAAPRGPRPRLAAHQLRGLPSSRWPDRQHAGSARDDRACRIRTPATWRPRVAISGSSSARLIAPGDAARSVLVVARAGRRDAAGMPPVGSALVDDAGVDLLGEWIGGLSSCQ